ncbi:MAG: phosphotransferase [Alphaproteobacteria bacterium]|nr:phosphotransferase [Alphaproteobacteria bacterium]
MSDRGQIIAGFLAAAGWQGAKRSPLAGDASARRYERLTREGTGQQAVLMDAPPESGEAIEPFLQVARFLVAAGFSAPEIYAWDIANGLILMEDLGDNLYARVCARSPALEGQLYEAAIDALCALHKLPPPDLPDYGQATYLREARLLVDWYLPVASGKVCSEGMLAAFDGLIGAACGQVETGHKTCVLRDYHAENLLWLPDRKGIAKVGQLDFQDALLGHPAYDLVSLLEDARRDTSAELRAAMIARYLDQSGAELASFRQAYAVLGAQRNLKIIGIFARLCLRDGKPDYINLIPRVWAHAERDLQHPVLADLKAFMDRYVPPPTPEILQRFKAAHR